MAAFVATVPGPVDGNVSDQLSLQVLREIGVARVSYGPQFYRRALADFGSRIEALVAEDGPARR